MTFFSFFLARKKNLIQNVLDLIKQRIISKYLKLTLSSKQKNQFPYAKYNFIWLDNSKVGPFNFQ